MRAQSKNNNEKEPILEKLHLIIMTKYAMNNEAIHAFFATSIIIILALLLLKLHLYVNETTKV